VASRAVKRPAFRVHERGLLVLLASLYRQWRHALLLVTPETVLRWHREGFRLFWRRRSRSVGPREPRLAPNVVALIHRMATENRLWGAERIRGEPRSPVRSRPPPGSEDCTMTTAPQRESSGRPKEPTQPREATALWQRGPRSDGARGVQSEGGYAELRTFPSAPASTGSRSCRPPGGTRRAAGRGPATPARARRDRRGPRRP